MRRESSRGGVCEHAVADLRLPWHPPSGSNVGEGIEEATMPQKTPQKHSPKKVGKSLKEKRDAKKAKKAAHKPLIS
jgi:hypothetical protein